MAEQEQAGIENVAPESSQPRQLDVPFSKVCCVFQILKHSNFCVAKGSFFVVESKQLWGPIIPKRHWPVCLAA